MDASGAIISCLHTARVNGLDASGISTLGVDKNWTD